MLLDFRAGDDLPQADLIIIGAGAAGLTLARELADTDLRILILEAGARDLDKALLGHEAPSLPYRGATSVGRIKAFGGSTLSWAGQSLKISSNVFGPRPWIEDADWPISPADIDPYYGRALKAMNVPDLQIANSPWADGWPEFDADQLSMTASMWSAQPNLAEEHEPWLASSRNVHCAIGAAVVRINIGARAESVVVRTLEGREVIVEADRIVVCSGEIEAPRLLLASGLGDRLAWTGKGFHDHVSIICAEIVPNDRKEFDEIFQNWYSEGGKLMPKLLLSAKKQESERLVEVGGHMVFGASGGFEALKGLRKAKSIKDATPFAGQALKSFPEAAAAAVAAGIKGRSYAPGNSKIEFEALCEQTPHNGSEIRLSNRKDEFGMPLPVIDFKIGEETQDSIKVLMQTVSEQLKGLAETRIYEDRLNSQREFHRWAGDIYHPMGATRMSAAPDDGVVDENLKVHGVDNLFVASTSCFPSGGWSNPTYAMLALTCRLADQIKN